MRRDEVGEFERDDLLCDRGRGFQFHSQIAPIGGWELDRHIAIEGFEVRPDSDAMFVSQFADALDKVGQLLVVHLAVLERADVERASRFAEDEIPVVEALFEGQRIRTELLGALGVGRDEDGKIAKLLAELADAVEELDDVGFVSAGFVAEIPTGKALVMAVALDRLFEEELVDFDLLPPGLAHPVEARIVGSKEGLEAIFVGEGVEHLADIVVDFQKVGEALRLEDALVLVPGADDDDGVDADPGVEFEFFAPIRLAPVLARDVVGDLVEESAGYAGKRGHGRF